MRVPHRGRANGSGIGRMDGGEDGGPKGLDDQRNPNSVANALKDIDKGNVGYLTHNLTHQRHQ